MVTWKRVTHADDTPTEHVALTTGRPGASGPGTCGPRWPLAAAHPKNRGNLVRYRLLGKSGVRISEVALGTMTFGEDWGWGAPPDISARMLDLFADAGGNVIDTADAYTNGTSETILGDLLKGRRDRFVLGTKFTNQTDPDDPNSAGNHRKKIVSSLEASLRRLQTDHIDLYWVHNRDVLTAVEELMRALDDQVRLGKVLYPPVSDWPAWELAEATPAPRLRVWSPFTPAQLPSTLPDPPPTREPSPT